MIGGETLSVISTAIGLLPANQQMVITLRDIEGWASDEICNALEISETNQRVLLHRARSKVRRALEVHFETSPDDLPQAVSPAAPATILRAVLVETVTEYLEGTMPASDASVRAPPEALRGCQIYVEQFRRTIEQSGRITLTMSSRSPTPAAPAAGGRSARSTPER